MHLINTLHFSFVINDIVLGLFSAIIWDKIKFKLKILHSIYFDWYCSVLCNWTLHIAQNYNHIKHVFEELLQKRPTNRWQSRRDESLGSRAIFWPFTKPRDNSGGTAPTKGGTTDFWHHSFHATPIGLMLKSRIQGDPVSRCPLPPVPPPIPRCQRLTKDIKFGYHRLRFATSNTLVSTPSGFNWIGKITALGAARTPLRCPLRRLTVYPTQRPIHPSPRSAGVLFRVQRLWRSAPGHVTFTFTCSLV